MSLPHRKASSLSPPSSSSRIRTNQNDTTNYVQVRRHLSQEDIGFLPCSTDSSSLLLDSPPIKPYSRAVPLPLPLPKSPTTSSGFDAHPLPLPPPTRASASPPPQSTTTVHYEIRENAPSLMKGSQWQKGKLIGRGTYGSVYHATNLETGASCAMKEVDLIPDDPSSIELLKQLEQVGDHLHIYMEYVNPGSINKFIHHHRGAMTESVVRNFTRHILSGLAYLHSINTIHRDIKGANLLVNESGIVKLADFGMAKILTGNSYELSFKGSPYWMAPEVMKAAIKNESNPDIAMAIDIWSLGCTIIEMITGKPPWSQFEGPSAMFKALHKSPPIPENLSSVGKDFLHQCFQRDPADRPSATMLLNHAFVQNLHDQDVVLHQQSYPRGVLRPRVSADELHLKSLKLSGSFFIHITIMNHNL
ncbi:hypothetical protein RIF29_06050 [Crotalaria pallida]|uniref:mitogen-activated protein kinase kinase kinase n=1 Tax=Crotalaria pallida TaxID=3830 RepID=A0AAN9PA42_CROPI